MKKKPEEMKLHDALDFFEENKAGIRIFEPKLDCNLEKQTGRVMMNNNLFVPKTDAEKLLFEQLQRAVELIKPYTMSDEKKKELQKILAERAYYKKELDKRLAGERRNNARGTNTSQDKIDGGPRENRKPKSDQEHKENPRQQDARRDKKTGDRANPTQTRRQENSPRDGQRDASGSSRLNNSRTENTAPVKKIEYVRGNNVTGAKNKVTVVELSDSLEELQKLLPNGEKMNLIPPYINPQYIMQCEQRFGIKLNIKKYLVMEMTPDHKILHINVLFGNLDLDLMSKSKSFLEKCMTTVLDKKRIDTICRNHFCTLDKLIPSGNGDFSVARDEVVDWIVGRSIVENSQEIRTQRHIPKSFWPLFSKQEQVQESNIIRLHKTGIMMVNNKQCLVYSYATKDETTEGKPVQGSFIVSGLDEKRFETDKTYREAIMQNVITPSRLYNSRRSDLPYPYIGQATPEGEFENNFDIIKSLNNIQIQI